MHFEKGPSLLENRLELTNLMTCQSKYMHSQISQVYILATFSGICDRPMTGIWWESVSPSEIRAETEAMLESQGESQRIRAYLNASPQIGEWREKVRELCREIVGETEIAMLTPDMLFEQIALRAHEMIPQEVKAEVRARLEVFLRTQFEDHIRK
jgi:hypothetical protein